MSSKPTNASTPPLDLSKWRNLPMQLMAGGALIVIIGAVVSFSHEGDRGREFATSWLLAFMFFLSACLGALFLVLVHHLFDAGWSVAIRRFCEHIATLLFPWMFLLFLPIAFLAPKL